MGVGEWQAMRRHDFQIEVSFRHRVAFGRDVFAAGNPLVADLLREGGGRRVMAVVEEAVVAAWPELAGNIAVYCMAAGFDFRGVTELPGGEDSKTDDAVVKRVWSAIDAAGIDRHSYMLAVGGGAFLDVVGFAAATAHRGVRLVRFPTTTLSQDDSGVGVKNAINALGKKNWVGTFAVPHAVVNDFEFLRTQDVDGRRAGLVEAVKVALVKDAEFFGWIEANAAELAQAVGPLLEECVERSALLHARHIADGGDPFEGGSRRPLDFGHWAAHKLERMSGFRLAHAKAVAAGVALDTWISVRAGHLHRDVAGRVRRVLGALGLETWHDMLEERAPGGRLEIAGGLEDFREHLGGRLTVLLLEDVGRAVEVHELPDEWIEAGVAELRGGWS